MSIAEKLTTIAENQQRVFDAGRNSGGGDYDSGWNDGYSSGYDNGYYEGTDDGYGAGFEEGKQAECDAFWDIFQGDYFNGPGERLHYQYAFAYNGFIDANYNPKYPIVPQNTNGIAYLFTWATYLTDTKVPITAYGKCEYAFNGAGRLKRIPKLIFSGATNVSGMFNGCTALEELYCEGELTINGLDLQYSTKLNKASIESIIGVLSTTTSGLSITLSKTAVTNAFGSTTAAEWTTLIGTKSNWTINLM